MHFPFAAFLCIIISGLCFSVFIVFNYAYNDPDSGLIPKLDSLAQRTMSDKWYNWWTARSNNIAAGFGILGITVLGIALLLVAAEATKTRQEI